MHILITADTVGGVWTYTRELVAGLLAQGHRVTLVSLGAMPQPEESARLRSLPGLEYFPTSFRLEWMPQAQKDIEDSQAFLADLVRAVEPDVLHLNQFCYGNLPVSVPRIVVAHSDVLSWWNAVYGSAPPADAWYDWYVRTVNQGVQGADVVVVPSRWMLAALGNNFAAPKNSAVIYNGRTPSMFFTQISKRDCALSVGRIWDQAKQSQLLLARSFAMPIRIVGPLQAPNAASTQASPGEVPPSAELLGARQDRDLRQLYAESGTYIASSCYEPFGLAPVEAAFSHCAIVANDIPTFRELWGTAALFYRKNDADSLAEALQQLCRKPELRRDLSRRAYRRARACFDAARMVAEYEQTYKVLLKGKVTV